MGNRRLERHRPLLRQLSLLLVLPVVVMSGSFALFSQQLSVNASSSSVAYVSNQYTTVTYTKTMSGTGPYTYTFSPMIIKNDGVTSITAWQVTFDLPPSMTSLTCPGTVVCSQNATTVTITNGAGNGTIVSGATTSFNFSFISTAVNYTLQNVNISATFATTYQTITGLTVTASFGTESGSDYPINMTITNNSGQSISGWQVVIPTNEACSNVTGLPSGVTFVCGSTGLTLTGTAVSIASGATYSFGAPLPNASATGSFNMNGTATVQGKA